MIPRPQRLASLDGLRGVAAATVVVHHAMLTIPVLAAAYFGQDVPTSIDWLVYSPLHLLWDGSGPVFVFFILSGLVVPLPALRGRPFSWAAFYPARLLRLYVPVWASLALAYGLIVLVPRVAAPGQSAWVSWHAEQFNTRQALRDAFLLEGVSPANSPLWSLQWEIAFSLLMPLYVLLAHVIRSSDRRVVATLAVAVCAVGVGGWFGIAWLTYLPMFAIGTALAVRLDRIRDLQSAIARLPRSGIVWIGVVAAALVALSSRWWLTPFLGGSAYPATFSVTVIGAAAAVVLAIACPAVEAGLSSRPARWGGKVSFSLYLVHEPVLVTLAFLLPPGAVWLVPVLGIAIAVPLAVLFMRVVESPSHRLARLAGRCSGDVSAALVGRFRRHAPALRQGPSSPMLREQRVPARLAATRAD